ncbi:MAG: helix-turn-helix transcriptional regulator [Oscillospiraceae bacterium]|nr:helix-turn-helix transcriptional regulator [Oscillospiraceae bacterium]
MTLAEKLKNARAAKHMSQRALAEAAGISLRTIQNYELGARMPKRRDTYTLLAEALGIDEKVLLDENADFVLRAGEQYGGRGARQAWDLVADFKGLCAGGEMEEEDMDAIMQALQEAYWDAKKMNRKYVNRRYRRDVPEDGA